MSVRVPPEAIRFMATTGRLAMKSGLKAGLRKAAAKENPVVMLLEAASSVAAAISSYLELRDARTRRDGLIQLIPHEAERLRVERQTLEHNLELARAEMNQRQRLQERIGALVLTCSVAYRTTWEELSVIRASELPDVEAYERHVEELDAAWQQLRHALANFGDSED